MLTYGNTLLLSNAAVSLGSAYSTRENLILFGTPNSLSFILACIFLSLQIKEFRNLGFYINDSVYGSILCIEFEYQTSQIILTLGIFYHQLVLD